MAHVTVFCFLASYAVAFALELSRLLGKSRVSRFVGVSFAVAGLVAHTWYLLNRVQATHLPPLLASTHDWMLVLAWLLVLLYLFLTLFLTLSRQDLAVGVFALPVVLLLVASTYLLSQEPSAMLTADQARRLKGIFHASLLVFGMATGAAGLISGIMYLVQHHRLKTRHAEPSGFRIPSLPRLAQINRWSMILTYFFLTLGFASGAYLALRPGSGTSSVGFADPAVIVSGVVWLLFGGLFARLVSPHVPSGRQVAWLTVSGCGFLLVTLLGLQVVTGSIHGSLKEDSPRARHAIESRGGRA
jgi:ABC-type uncharacterized transport system permease subunit